MRRVLAAGWMLAVTQVALAAPNPECTSAQKRLHDEQQTLADERRSLDDCKGHPGGCSSGQMQGFQTTIDELKITIGKDELAARLACSPPPQPHPPPQTFSIIDISPDAAFGQQRDGTTDPGGQIDAIAVDPNHQDIVYAGGETSGVWRSRDGARTWTHSSVGIEWGSTIFGGLAVDKVNWRRILYATTPDDLGPGTAGTGWGGHSGLYVSLNAGDS
jgi:hypothetical protein